MDIARLIRDRLRAALEHEGGANIATSINVDRSGHTTSVYSDDDVTIIDRDGEREVIHHRPASDGDEDPGDG